MACLMSPHLLYSPLQWGSRLRPTTLSRNGAQSVVLRVLSLIQKRRSFRSCARRQTSKRTQGTIGK